MNNIDTEKYGPNCIGNVIRILDNRTLIVNADSDRLSIGKEVTVYTPVEPILDIDGKELAIYEYPKDTLKVVDVNERYSVCRKVATRIAEPSATTKFALSPLFQSKEEFIPLNVDEDEISPLKEIDKKIHVGDPIKLA